MINKKDIQNLRDLVYLYALSKSHNKKAVSDEFGISIDTLNKYITELEGEIDTKLIFSNSRGTLINPEGKAILEIANDIAQKLHFFDAYINGENQYAGDVRFRTSGVLIDHISSPAFLEFTKMYPNINVEANITTDASDIDMLETDVSIDYFRPSFKDSVIIAQKKIRFELYAAASYLEEYGYPKDIDDLCQNHRMCLKNDRCARIPELNNIINNMKHIVYTSDSFMVFKAALDSGIGVGFCPVASESSNLMALDRLGVGTDIDVYLVAHQNTKDIPRIRLFINYIKNVLERNYN